ncbi:MAG: glycosyltransferase [Anaerolineales bacterium]
MTPKIKKQRQPKVAIVHDRLNVRGGGERVLEEIAALFPRAPIYTLIYEPSLFADSEIGKHAVRTSFIQRLPKAASHHRYYIPLMPLAVEGFDLSRFDIIISSSAAFAHGVRTTPRQLHISYIHSPMRYAWHQYQQHVARSGVGSPFIRLLLAYLRRWDRGASQSADWLLANSAWTTQLIRKAFHRQAEVLYPPVHTEWFKPAAQRDDYYLAVSRLVPYKRVDLIVGAFSKLGRPLVVVGEGPEGKKIRSLAKGNIRILGYQPRQAIIDLMQKAKAFVHAAEEDFGIAAVEAQAAGLPVLAYGHGGLTETVVEGRTGLFFREQTEESLMGAVIEFEAHGHFNARASQKNAERFSVDKFKSGLAAFVDQKWHSFLGSTQFQSEI